MIEVARPAEAENGCVSETADAVRRRLPREAARRRQAVATLRLAEAVARYAADQLANGLAPEEARAAAIDAAGELAEMAALLRKLTRLGPAERRELALELGGLGWDKHRIAVRLGLSDSAVRYYFRPRFSTGQRLSRGETV